MNNKKKMSFGAKFYMVLVYAFLYLPILVLIVYSFNESKSRAVFSGFTFDWYAKLFHNEAIMSALLNSLVVAVIASVAATAIGTLAAVGINAMGRKMRSLVMNFTYLPVINPEIVIGVSLMLLFVFLRFQFGLTTLIIAHITFDVPYVILNVMPKLRQMDAHQVEAARDLGCNPVQAFFKVVIPEIMPGIMSGFLMALTYSFDDFIISHFVAGPTAQTLPLAIYSMTRKKVSPEINALSAVMFAVILSLLVIYNLISARRERSKGRAGR